MASYLVTSTSRGIGLELVKQRLELPATEVSKVFAVTRDSPSSALQQLIDGSKGRALNSVIPDITKEDNVVKGAAEVEAALNGHGLDVLVNNMGVGSYSADGI